MGVEVGTNVAKKCLTLKTRINMLLIEYFPIKANGNIKQKKFDSPYILKEYVFSILYEGNLSRFFLMRDRNRREIFSILTPIAKYSGEKEKMLSYEDYFIKTNNEGNIIQKRWRGNLETFSYDEKGYITQYEYYYEGMLQRRETTSYFCDTFGNVRIAEVINLFYIKEEKTFLECKVRDVYEYADNGKTLKSERFLTNIDQYCDDYTEYKQCKEYLAYEQFYDGKWDILNRRFTYNRKGEVIEVDFYTQNNDDNHFERIKELLIEGYNEEYGEAQYSVFYSPQKLDIDYCTLDTFETLGVVNCLGDLRLGSVIFDQEGNIDNGYILSYEGSNFEDSGDWPKYEVGRVNVEGETEWGCEYDWRGYTWELSLFENGELREKMTSEVHLSINEAVSVFMPLKCYRKD